MTVAAWSQPGLALLAGTDWGDANALPPPSSLGGEIGMLLCWGFQTLPAESSRLGTALCQGMALWHCLTKLQFVIVWHNDMYDHNVLWKITTSSARIR